ncbi:MAG: TetR/AcrR family transcriptional regulator [Cyclobacteriaceae bacterium]
MTKLTRKQQIDKQAAVLFKTKGYAASSMRDLAQVLGIEAASLYSHIKSKEEILHRICFRMADAFFAAQKETEYLDSQPEVHLKKAIAHHLEVISQNIDDAAVFFHEWRHLSEPYLSEFLVMRGDYEQQFITIIERGIQVNTFRVVDAKLTAMTVLSAMNWIHRWYKPDGKLSIDQISEQLAEMMIKGLKS